MTSHFTVLPSDIIQFLSDSLNEAPFGRTILEANKRPLRILRLPHPRSGQQALFVPLESPSASAEDISKVLEVQAVAPPDERSWILDDHIVADGKLLTLTPMDPAFLLLPIMQATRQSVGSSSQFRTAEDIFEEAAKKMESSKSTGSATADGSSSPLTRDILEFSSLRCTRSALTRLCDVKRSCKHRRHLKCTTLIKISDISPEIVVYRYSASKFLEYLRLKVSHLERCSAFEQSKTIVRGLAKDGLMEDGKEELLQLGRVHACCDLLSQYLPQDVSEDLKASYNLTTLETYLATNKEDAMKVSAAAPTKVTKSKGKEESKTGGGDKKRKTAKASHGVEKLKKADVGGMAKLSSFFNKG
ncbi:ribonuclease H2, subunit B [Crassisporium funariophilum]|nr:ribonuclease H2, subunit B [Crassisporium funariophilum]